METPVSSTFLEICLLHFEMRLLRVLCTAAFFACALAKLDLAEIITKTPRCAQECSLKVLSDAKCPLDEMASCLCTNRDLQKTLATCVLKTCNVTDQYGMLWQNSRIKLSLTSLIAATSVRQEIICKGMPTDSRTKDIVTTFIILAVVTYPIVVLRIISRWVIAHKIWWDDWCILLATVSLSRSKSWSLTDVFCLRCAWSRSPSFLFYVSSGWLQDITWN